MPGEQKEGRFLADLPPRLYCPSCGEEVEYFVMLSEGDEIIHCSICGLILQPEKKKEEARIKTLQNVIAAEDSQVLLKTLSQMMLDKKITQSVEACKNGEDFITKVMERFKQNLPISLAILDVAMPVLNGINAAVVFRAIEKGFGKTRKTPILFFTSYRCDDTFQKVLKYCAPAKYINKGTGSSPEEFAERLYQVISQLLVEQ
jgi:CheY-like chemotaxis protein/rubredoxin